MNENLDSALYSTLRHAIVKIGESVHASVYAISFYVEDEEDDPRRPTVTVGYNTSEHANATKSEAADLDEAKWNYAFWLQNSVGEFGFTGSETDALVQAWLMADGLHYSDDEEEADIDRCLGLGEQITAAFIMSVVEVARKLHEEGVMRSLFKPGTPILVHELEYYDEIADQNRRVNPDGSAEEFADWVENL